MLYFILILLGIGLGSQKFGESGPIIGAVLGFLSAWLFKLQSKVEFLQQKLTKLEQSTKQAPHKQQPLINTSANRTTEKTPENILKTSQGTADDDFDKLMDYQQEIELEQDDLQDEVAEPNITHKTPSITTEPSFLEKAFNKFSDAIVAYFKGGNALVRTGMLVLFVGIAFLLKYVAQHTVIPVQYRYYAIIAGSIVMFFFGYKLRKKRRGYALSLQGGGIGLLYLTLFAAMRIHHLIDAKIVLILLIIIVVVTALLAVIQNSLAFAVIGMIGGFAAPILTSSGHGSHVQLFSYYLLLNLGIFTIAWFKSWRLLNIVGFVATFGIGTAWGLQFYQPEYFNTVEPFLIAYFLMYTIIAILFAIKQPPKLQGITDSTLIFGTPLLSFGLQAALLQDSHYGLSYSALALFIFYVLLAGLIKLMKKPLLVPLMQAFSALGIGFGTLAIPLAFDARVTSAMWVLEAAAMSWVGIKQNRILPRFAGYLLMALGTFAYFYEPATKMANIAWMNANYIGIVLVAGATAFIGFYMQKHHAKLFAFETPNISHVFIINAALWWSFGGSHEIVLFYPEYKFMFLQMFFAINCMLLLYFANKWHFGLLKNLALFNAFLMLLAWQYILQAHQLTSSYVPILNQRFLGLLVFSLSYYGLAWYYQRKKPIANQTDSILSYLLLVVAIFSWLVMGLFEINSLFSSQNELYAFEIFVLFSIVGQLLLAHKIDWHALKLVGYATLPGLLFFAFVALNYHKNFHAAGGLLVWASAALVNYYVLKRYQKDWRYVRAFHLLSALLFAFILVFEGAQSFELMFGKFSIWHNSASALFLLLIATVIYRMKNVRLWPFQPFHVVYFKQILPLLVLVLSILLLNCNFFTIGYLTLIPYIPVLNSIDLVTLGSLFLIGKMFENGMFADFSLSSNSMKRIIVGSLFVFINASLLRCFHYWYGIDYTPHALFASFKVQMAISIFWTLSAVGLMIYASQKKLRPHWMAGMGLIVVVILKLFFVDMSASGTIERIVTFLVVGVLLSLVGYFSPLPPEIKANSSSKID